MMTDPIFNPTAGAGQGTNPQTQTADTHQDIFGGSHDIFNNPSMFQPVEGTASPAPTAAPEDFTIDFGQLEANHTVEPVVIEPPQVKQETWNEYQARQVPPQPEIIEQVIEPEMKPEVKVNPWKQPAPAPRPQVQAPVKPVIQAAPIPRPQVQTPVKPIVQPVQAPAKPQVQAPRPQVQAPVKPVVQPVQVVKAPEIKVEQPQTVVQNTSSDLQKKLTELIDAAHKVYTIEKKESDQILELLGANNDKVSILYQISLPENGIVIKKIETDIASGEENINDLGFVLDTDTHSLHVILDDVLLLDEVQDLKDDVKKKMQVTEKLNKFIFLLSEHQKKAEKEMKEKEEAEQDRRRLQDIFRNF